MTKIAALIPELRQLTRQEKWEAMEFLVRELATEEPPLLEQNRTYPVWSPHDAFSAGEALLKALEEEKSRA
jgi:hypothetical protein